MPEFEAIANDTTILWLVYGGYGAIVVVAAIWFLWLRIVFAIFGNPVDKDDAR